MPLALYGTGDNKPSLHSVLKKVITFPPFIALLLAFLLQSFTYPATLTNLLKMMAATLVPPVMVAVGFELTFQLNKKVISQLSIGLAIKLLIAPLAALFVCKISDLRGEAVQVSIFVRQGCRRWFQQGPWQSLPTCHRP